MMLSFGARGSRSRFLDETWALGGADFLNHFTDLSGGALLTRAHPAVRLLAVRAGAVRHLAGMNGPGCKAPSSSRASATPVGQSSGASLCGHPAAACQLANLATIK